MSRSNGGREACTACSATSPAAAKPSRPCYRVSPRPSRTASPGRRPARRRSAPRSPGATRSASVAVAGQFETIRETAAKERDQTAQSLRSAIDETNAQLTGALERAAERFRQSVSDVKDMAAQVQRDLDATRQELRRGVLELPQETTETADAMRRVVSDQIRALKELASLVTESGASFDVSEPAQATGTGGGGVGVGVGGGLSTRLHPAPLDPAPEPARVAAGRESALARVAEALDTPLDDHPLPAIVPPRIAAPEAPPAAPPASQDRGQPGWLSSLLAAASRDEEIASPAHGARTPETLDALTEGIAGLIDNAAAADMWDRWRRGDATGVSRRLYTEAGQETFDEIRRRYRSDAQFRETAARYTQEFERLLSKVSQNDRDGTQWRAYLMSNAGKVYTMLAHASGRLG